MSKTFQAPPGTRDFYPEAMALRRYIEDTWRRVSLRYGFVEVDGPTFESLDLYRVKSGDEIVSQLFHFASRTDKQGEAEEFALRPEFTPTLARMIAAKANSLPRPIKWFSIPRCFRAERQQKGRLKEFFQWNVDMLGGETPEARRQFDLEVVALCLDCLQEFGLSSSDVKLLWNDRTVVEKLFALASVRQEKFPFAFYLLDRIAKLSPDQRKKSYADNQLTEPEIAFFEKLAAGEDDPISPIFWENLTSNGEASWQAYVNEVNETTARINHTLSLMGFDYPDVLDGVPWVEYDASIVRGLAYYTGFVWEVVDARGENRAVAGGGRYDKLIEMFGGPSLAATGFGMGDVVLEIILREKAKLPASLATKADVFVISALEDAASAMRILSELRTSQWNAQHTAIVEPGLAAVVSYKATKNIGKLLQDASASGAKVAVILAPAEWERGVVKVKDLVTREEREVAAAEVVGVVRGMVKNGH